ncbi:MAG: type II secretion system protein GspN [Deltaproteobacteria bacterium]|nr:type II secretion system protein GspN [Deltaproteobacteria bacterium]
MMKNTPKWLLYSIYVLAAIVFFIYYLFPSDKVKNYVTSGFNNINSDINISIDHVSPAFPFGLKLFKVNFYHMDNALLETDQIKVVPNLLSLFRSKIIFFFQGRAFEGILEGKGEFIKNRPDQNVIIEGKFSNINIKEMSAVKQYIGRNLTGMLEGNFTYRNGKKSGATHGARFVISDGEIELLKPVFKLENIYFSKIEAEMTMENQRVKVKRCIIKASPLDGNVSGLINLREPFGQSNLRLLGVIKPNREFLIELGKDFPANLLPEKIFSKRVVRIRIYGTLDEPRFFLD